LGDRKKKKEDGIKIEGEKVRKKEVKKMRS
jgi:hypothetical protein